MSSLLLIPVFFFTHTATTEIYTLSLHDALPILRGCNRPERRERSHRAQQHFCAAAGFNRPAAVLPGDHIRKATPVPIRSEEHTSELQSLRHLVCRLLLEKKKKYTIHRIFSRAS